MWRLLEIGRSRVAMCSGKQIPVEPSSVFAARAALSYFSGSSRFWWLQKLTIRAIMVLQGTK
jgi:hypothetical protein